SRAPSRRAAADGRPHGRLRPLMGVAAPAPIGPPFGRDWVRRAGNGPAVTRQAVPARRRRRDADATRPTTAGRAHSDHCPPPPPELPPRPTDLPPPARPH